MKILSIVCIGSIALAFGVFAQTPTLTPELSPAALSPTPSVSISPAASISPSVSVAPSVTGTSGLADKIHKKFDKKLRHKGINFQIDGDENADGSTDISRSKDVPEAVIPIVAIVMFAVFGAPVFIVAVILYFGFSRSRMMHKTVRMMVEKGQPVPAALLNPPPAVRKRSDMRRGVVLVMIGIGLMIFLAAVNEGEGGAWAIGVIPFLIGAGYLLVWKLEGKGDVEAKADNPPPLP